MTFGDIVSDQQDEYRAAAAATVANDAKCWCGGRVAVATANNPLAYICADSSFHDPFATGRPERVTTLYVAGPMSGYEDCNYPAFRGAERLLEDVGYNVVNPADVHVTQCHYVDLIREDLRVMLDCHGVAVLDNWWESVGARNEVNVAGMLKMPVRPVADWLERAHRELSS